LKYRKDGGENVKGWRRLAISTVLFAAALAGLPAQAKAAGASASVRLMAVIPAVLRLSLDFSRDATAGITGYIPGDGTEGDDASYVGGGSRFEIRRGATLDLGNARLFSNVATYYSVNVYSANGGSLRDPTGASDAAISYNLRFGNSSASAQGGTFTFVASGTSTSNSAPLRVALEIRDVPNAAASGYYTDQLMFAMAAN